MGESRTEGISAEEGNGVLADADELNIELNDAFFELGACCPLQEGCFEAFESWVNGTDGFEGLDEVFEPMSVTDGHLRPTGD